MGNSSSGYWRTRYRRVEAFRRINLAEVRKGHDLTPQSVLQVTYQKADGNKITFRIELEQVPARFGGHRLWLRCPRCYTRRQILYVSSYVACRKCLRLRYSSQWEGASDRALRGMHRIEQRLAGEVWGGEMPPKPKGMHQRTYERLAERHEFYDVRWSLIIGRRLGLQLPDWPR